MDPIRSALKDAGISGEEVDFILLVGGSTRIPYVRKFIETELGKLPGGSLVDPDLAVVRGAGIQAGILSNAISPEDGIIITDVCPYTLGVSILDYIGWMPVPDVFDVIIPRNTTIPVTKEKIYCTSHDNQTAVKIEVYQGENKKASSNNFLGKFMLDGVPPAPEGKEKVKVAFSYDVNGILQVEGSLVSTGKKASITVETSKTDMKAEINTDGWQDAPDARKYRAVIHKAEKILESGQTGVYEVDIDTLVRQLKLGLLRGEEKESLEKYKEELNDILYDLEGDENDN
jgi:molecular chaperone DnaK